jgi:guanosine-3',5'-bis(diphosphate) 3'-pyrophosphohydrolase
LSMVNVASDFTEMALELEVWDLRQLSHIIAQLKELQCISTVKRVFD